MAVTCLAATSYTAPTGVLTLGSAGDATVARMYQVSTGANPSISQLDAWLKLYDNGTKSMTTVAQNFAYNAGAWFGIEFPNQDTGPAPAGGFAPISDVSFVTDLYTNMLGRTPNASQIATYTSILTTLEAMESQAAARGEVLYDFASSTEAIIASHSYLSQTTTGGSADGGLPFTAAQVLNDGVTNDYLNLNLLTAAAAQAAGSTGATTASGFILTQDSVNGAWVITAGTAQNGGAAPASYVNNQGVVILSPQVTEAVVNGNNAHVYNGATSATPTALSGQSSLAITGIALNGTGDWLDLNPQIAAKVVIGGNTTLINGFVGNFDQVITPNVLAVEKAGATGVAIVNVATNGASLNFAKTAYVMNLGTVANSEWQASAVAAAANAAYTPAHVAGEALDFLTQVSGGSSHIWEWNGGTLDAAHLTQIVTLTGVTANSLTAHDFDALIAL